jgi:hypothetical protein
MKKIILLLAVFSLISCSTTKLNSYGKINNNSYQKIKTQAEIISLKITSVNYNLNGGVNNNRVESLSSFSLSDLIIEQVLKIPDYIGKIIKDRKKKYTQNYKTKTTLDFLTGPYKKESIIKLPKLDFRRKIFTADTTTNNKNAIQLEFIPKPINDSLFVFKLDTININYTKAKTTKKYPFVNLIIEIKATYYEKDDNGVYNEKEYTAQSIKLPVKNGLNLNTMIDEYPIYSDPFKINDLRMIEITVTETNPYYIKLEELETNLTENKGDLTTILTKLTELIKSSQ